MVYIIDILTHEKKKKSFRITADNEEQAKERLQLRMPPNNRDNFTIESIKIDASTLNMEEPFGSFYGD